MSIETDLQKDGIQALAPINTLATNSIAKSVATKLCQGLPELDLTHEELFIKLARLNMYVANIPEGMAEANYCYKNSSVYFSNTVDFSKIDKFAIHECIHHLQEVRDKSGTLIRLGLCDFTEFKAYGMALNEAAVQLMTSKVIAEKEDTVKYYGVTIKTSSPDYYPLLCVLVKQMSYVTGEYCLYHSAFYSDNSFKSKFSSLCGESAFSNIQKGLDVVLYTEEKIIELTNLLHSMELKISSNEKLLKKIDKYKKVIQRTFLAVQNTIITSYFDNLYKQLYTLEDIENYRNRLYHFKDYIGTTKNYTFFNDYYINKMEKIEKKKELLEGSDAVTSLVVVHDNKLLAFFHSIKKLFSKNKSNVYKYTDSIK